MSAPTVQWITQTGIFNTIDTSGGGNQSPSIALLKNVIPENEMIYITYFTFAIAGTGSVFYPSNTLVGLIDIVVMKMRTIDGGVVWIRQLSTFNSNNVNSINFNASIAVDSDGNAYVAYFASGATSGNSHISEAADLVVFKLDTNGNTLWVQQNNIFNPSSSLEDPNVSIVVGSTNIYVTYAAGTAVSGGISGDTIVVMAMAPDGSVVWIEQQDNFNAGSTSVAPSICIDSSDNLYIEYFTEGATSNNSNTGSYDTVIFKMNSSGTLQWIIQNDSFNTTLAEGISAHLGVPGAYPGNRIVLDNLGNIYAIYTTDGVVSGQTGTGATDTVVAKFSTNTGSLIWIRQQPAFNSSSLAFFPTIAYDATTNTIIACYQTDTSTSGNSNVGGADIVIFGIDSTGTPLWTLQNPTFDTIASDYLPAVVANNGNAYVTYGTLGTVTNIGPEANGSNVYTGELDVVVLKLAPLVCLAGETLITMSDGSLKEIKNIQRGDITSTGYTVAKLRKEPHHYSGKGDLITFDQGCLGNNLPFQKIIVTPAHPFFYQGSRRPASCFTNLPGVTLHKNVTFREFFQTTDQTVYLYDLQFDCDGSYLANGVEVQSRSPNSHRTPLEKDLYFDVSLYSNKKVSDFETTHKFPLLIENLIA